VSADVPPAADTTLATEPVAADSVAADSVAADIIAPDSLAVSDSTGIAVDSAEAAVEEGWLETLYASVETDFPGTPFAERARNLREALSELRSDEAPPDTSAAGIAETARADSLRNIEEALRGTEPLDALKGLRTWSIYATPAREFAEEILQYTADAGYRAALYTEGAEGESTYHVVVGQFTTAEVAEAARSEVEAIPDVEDLVLLDLGPGTPLASPTQVLQRGGQ
jgi:hypothetical protein